MTLKTKILFSIMSSLLFVVPSAAAEFTYQEYTKTPEVWKRLRIWNIAVYGCRGAARRRASLSCEDGFPAMPRQLNGYSSCPRGRGICCHQSR
jgi:hypothetical protein